MPGPVSGATGDGGLSVESGPGRAGALAWKKLDLRYRVGEEKAGPWRLSIEQLDLDQARVAERIVMDCARGRTGSAGPRCEQGQLEWTGPSAAWTWQGELSIDATDSGPVARVSADGMALTLRGPAADRPVSARAEFDGLVLDQLPTAWFELLGLSEIGGQLSGVVDWNPARMVVDLDLDDAGFDSLDGTHAGAGMDLELAATLGFAEAAPEIEGNLLWRAGEMLLGPLYLPPPKAPLELAVAGRFSGEGEIGIERLVLNDPGALEVTASAQLARTEEAWTLQRFELERFSAHLPAAWNRWADGPAAAAGFGGLVTAGTIVGSMRWREGDIRSLTLEGRSLDIDDASDRFAVEGGGVDIGIDGSELDAVVDWGTLRLWQLPLGGSRLGLTGTRERFELVEPLVMPLLDGAVVVDELVWSNRDERRELNLDARIEPLDLSELTRLLGFPEFGGTLSGRFPGVVYADERLDFTGGIDVEAFSGRITLTELAIERPFGTLPALAAQVEFDRLDLAELTGAFNFGHMEGQLSGWMRDLRLLDWQPVAMDARLFTHEDAPRRRISQRAVENLSSLGGGGGGALISGTILRVFEEFPYRRAGLACRLNRNICHIDGVAPHDSGGFYIVEGRSLPRLDVVGHRRLINWPQLVAQLMAMTEGQGH
ncbi:MAG: hypothetical protein ACOCSR_00235 [Wenzhouxiangella sp.]